MQENNNPEQQNTVPNYAQPKNSLIKDLMIPVSIVIAGLFIGGGLYMSGSAPMAQTSDGSGNGVQPEEKLTIPQLAEKAGVDVDAFNACVKDGALKSDVQADVDNAIATGGQGTPWSVVVGPGGKTYPLNGALPQAAVEQVIALALAEASEGPDSSDNQDTNLVNPVTADDHIKGNLDAKVKIVEYSDFDCPFCHRFHDTMNSISDKYDDSEVAWVYRHLPLEQLHPNAPVLALASECVADLGGNDAFWVFADAYAGS